MITPIASSVPILPRRVTPVDHRGRRDTPDGRPEQDVEVQQRDCGEAAETRVRQAVADVARTPEHDVDVNEPAQGPGERRHHEAGAAFGAAVAVTGVRGLRRVAGFDDHGASVTSRPSVVATRADAAVGASREDL